MTRLRMPCRAAMLLLMMLVAMSGPADGQTVFPDLGPADGETIFPDLGPADGQTIFPDLGPADGETIFPDLGPADGETLFPDLFASDGETLFPDLRTPLCVAVERGDLAAVQALVDERADVNEACTFTESDYPLLIAAQYGRLRIGEALLAAGAVANKAGFLGYTALLRAGEAIDPRFLELLLQSHADIHATLIHLEGLDLNLGLDVLSLTTASYLRQYVFASQQEQDEMDENYAAILDLLFDYCLDFKELGGASKVRLESENHSAQANLVDDKMKGKGADC